jgi:hypothetical protein
MAAKRKAVKKTMSPAQKAALKKAQAAAAMARRKAAAGKKPRKLKVAGTGAARIDVRKDPKTRKILGKLMRGGGTTFSNPYTRTARSIASKHIGKMQIKLAGKNPKTKTWRRILGTKVHGTPRFGDM